VSAQQVRIPSVGGTLYTLYDAAGCELLIELLNEIIGGSAPSSTCESTYADMSTRAAGLLRVLNAQRLASTRPTVNGNAVARDWAGGCWFTVAQMSSLNDLNRNWTYIQTTDCAQNYTPASTSTFSGKTVTRRYTTADIDPDGPEIGMTSFDPGGTRTADFTITKVDPGAVDDDFDFDGDSTYVPAGAEAAPMSTGMKLALGAGALLAVALLVRGLK